MSSGFTYRASLVLTRSLYAGDITVSQTLDTGVGCRCSDFSSQAPDGQQPCGIIAIVPEALFQATPKRNSSPPPRLRVPLSLRTRYPPFGGLSDQPRACAL